MKVGVNLLWMVPGVVGGSEQYLCRQLVGLDEAGAVGGPDGFEVALFGLRTMAPAHGELTRRYRVESPPVGRGNRAWRVALESTWLVGAAKRNGVDLVHHGGGTVPGRRGGLPAVLTIHDLQYLTYPQTFTVPKLAYLREVVPRSVRRAAVVCVPSEYVRRTVLESFSLPGDRVVVVPHGIPDEERRSPPSQQDDLRRRYGLRAEVIVYPAITYPHKNHVTLVRALAGLAGVQLVLLGGRGPAEEEIAAEAERLGVGDRVVRPGRVSDADRDGLVAMAGALAFPSRYEGFGAPVLEAMRLGTPVVAASGTALEEVVGGAGLLVDPDDVDGWRAALTRVLSEPGEATRLRLAGAERAAQLTGAASGRALASAYRLALL